MQNLNKSMEARLVKMDERMINWGGSTCFMDNMPKGTKIPRQEASEKCEENPSMPRQHARAGVMWAGVATSSNATQHPRMVRKFSRQAPGIKETTCLGSKHTFCLGIEEIVCHGNEELTCPSITEATCLGSLKAARPGSRQAACPGSTEATCLGSEELVCARNTEATCPGSKEPVCPGNEELICPSSTEKFYPGSTYETCPDNTESICPDIKLTFCFSGEQNDYFNGNCLSDKITDCLENEAQSMVIPPTIYGAPKSLLMEMFKKSEDNDTWKLDDFKNDVHSIDFQRIFAEDCHNNWLEQQLPQQRRLHQTMMEVKANEVIKWLDVITIFPNPIFMPLGKITRWSIYMNFKGKRNKNISTVAAQREVAEIPLAQVFLGRIVTRWRV
ncbi:hypothetical protein V6N11_071738 [Hibiscus sabdariffa]|uniref:Uncharacterized protein n=1 Tax=Hibiscus sabdariffa TaxID=183260 RepID=A0ABR2U0Y7_9ROSI